MIKYIYIYIYIVGDVDTVEQQTTQTDTCSQNEYTFFPIRSQAASPPWRTVLTINDIQVEMEIDTGASVSLISI